MSDAAKRRVYMYAHAEKSKKRKRVVLRLIIGHVFFRGGGGGLPSQGPPVGCATGRTAYGVKAARICEMKLKKRCCEYISVLVFHCFSMPKRMSLAPVHSRCPFVPVGRLFDTHGPSAAKHRSPKLLQVHRPDNNEDRVLLC